MLVERCGSGARLGLAVMQQCAALARLNLEGAPGGPAVISSSRLVDVSVAGGNPFPLAQARARRGESAGKFEELDSVALRD